MIITAMIPARIGSKRIKNKNLKLMNGNTLPGIACDIALKSGVFDNVVLNSDSYEILDSVQGVEKYMRPKEYADDSATTDDFLYDFLTNHKCDIVCIVNPTAPLLHPQTLADAIIAFRSGDYSTLQSVIRKRIHFYCGDYRNYNTASKLERTQDLEELVMQAFSFMGWKSKIFVDSYKMIGFGYWLGPCLEWDVSAIEAIDIDDEKDWATAERLMKATV